MLLSKVLCQVSYPREAKEIDSTQSFIEREHDAFNQETSGVCTQHWTAKNLKLSSLHGDRIDGCK